MRLVYAVFVVFGILVLMGLASLTVFIERIITLRRSRRGSRKFVAESGSHVREEMIDTIIDSLARNNLVVVHGASGSGKSSIVRAGVLPWLELQQSGRGGWRTGWWW